MKLQPGIGMAAAALVAFAASLFAAPPGYGDAARSVEIAIEKGRVVGSRSVRVTRGDTVTLRWTSDERLELHLHGYDVTVAVAPGAPAEMKIRARATGRFPVEIHGRAGAGGHGHGHATIFHLEVYPD